MYLAFKKLCGQRGITPIISIVLLLSMVVVISAAAYTWFAVNQQRIMTTSETQVATVQTSLAGNLRILALNSTRTGVVVQNLGNTNITSVNVIVNGETVIISAISIPAGGLAVVPIENASVRDDNTIEVSLVGPQFGTARKIFVIAENYEIEILNVTCSPCTLGTPGYCIVTIDMVTYCSNWTGSECVYASQTNATKPYANGTVNCI